jgi:hypothetical protein
MRSAWRRREGGQPITTTTTIAAAATAATATARFSNVASRPRAAHRWRVRLSPPSVCKRQCAPRTRFILLCIVCCCVLVYSSAGPPRSWRTHRQSERTISHQQSPSDAAELAIPRSSTEHVESPPETFEDQLVGLLQRHAPLVDQQLFAFRLVNNDESVHDDAAGAEEHVQTGDWAEWRWDPESNKVSITGSTPSAIARVLADFYLEQCGLELVSWAATSNESQSQRRRSQRRRTNTPGSSDSRSSSNSCTRALARMPKRASQRISSKVPWRYYFNQVTAGYSTVWWGWERWERELDWMALRGVNVALAHVGQEAIWRRVLLRDYGVDTAADFLTSEVYLSWHRMGNLKVWVPWINADEHGQTDNSLAHTHTYIYV